MNVDVLVSTMNQQDGKVLLEKLNINDNYVIINQINNNNIKELIQVDETNKKFFSYIGKGLSKSRNLAINKSTADVIAIADDDMTYQKDYTNIIKEAYEKHKDADIIAFVVEHEDKKDEKKVLREGRIGFLKSMKISSVQMTVNRESILKKSIKFDEDFGAGSKYYMGEENIFLFDCLKKGLKIYYVPKKIAILRKSESTWFKGYTKEYFNNLGAVYYRMSKIFYLIFIIQYAIRKYKYYKNDFTIMQVMKYMYEGVNRYKREKDESSILL